MSDASQGRRPATALDVACLAGVSRSAVSRAFTPGASVAAETRERVMRAARRLDYRPHEAARSLILRRSGLIALVLGNLENQFLSALAARLLARLQGAAFRTLLFQAASRGELDGRLAEALAHRPAAILVTGYTPGAAAARRCAEAGSPVLLINRAPPASHPAARTGTDHVTGGRVAAEALAASGHERVAAVVGDPSMSTNRARLRGLRAGLRAAGLRLVAVRDAPFGHAGGRAAALSLLGVPPARRPDALFCSGDALALGALDAARHDLGLRVPRDLGVIGFDDVEAASWPSYGLTTVRQPVGEVLDDVMARLERLHAGQGLPGHAAAFAPSLVRRGTLRSERARTTAAVLEAGPPGR